MLEDSSVNLTRKTKCPCSRNIFSVNEISTRIVDETSTNTVDETSTKFPEDKMKVFHTFVMKIMFLCKQARQNIFLGIVYLATKVKEPK
jgi:hypothetical protein